MYRRYCQFRRPAGAPIRGFGGVSQGSAPLVELMASVKASLDPLVGKPLSATAIVDIMNKVRQPLSSECNYMRTLNLPLTYHVSGSQPLLSWKVAKARVIIDEVGRVSCKQSDDATRIQQQVSRLFSDHLLLLPIRSVCLSTVSIYLQVSREKNMSCPQFTVTTPGRRPQS